VKKKRDKTRKRRIVVEERARINEGRRGRERGNGRTKEGATVRKRRSRRWKERR
jgi:hypothetical protein